MGLVELARELVVAVRHGLHAHGLLTFNARDFLQDGLLLLA